MADQEVIQEEAVNPVPEGTGDAPIQETNPQGDQPQGSEPKLPGWTSGLKADVREQYKDKLSEYQTPTDIVTKYFELADKAIVKPGEDATEEDRAAYRVALGIPEKADGYEIDTSEVPESVRFKDDVKWFQEVAHKANLTGEQAQTMYNDVMGVLAQAEAQKAQAAVEAEEALKKTWGDNYTGNMEIAGKAMKEFADDEFREYLEESGMGNNPKMAEFLHRIGKSMLDDNFVRGESVSRQENTKPYMTYPKMREVYGDE